ncbi:MAG: hypothetical protein LUE19_04180 [Clostridiales bacterium]|nr:hypothetical protein [Clostridiales bacterium]
MRNHIYQKQWKAREKAVKQRYRARNLFENKCFCNLCIAGFMAIDLLCFKTLWNLTMTASPVYVWMVSLGCAAALDLPLAVAAVFVKRCRQGDVEKPERNLILILAIAAFGIAFVLGFFFRLNTAYLSFDIASASTLANTVSTAVVDTDTESSAVVRTAAMFNAMLPLLTSLSSFILSYVSTVDREEEELARMEKERLMLQKQIAETNAVISECEDPESYGEALAAQTKDIYDIHQMGLDDLSRGLKEEVRLMLMLEMETPEDLTNLAKAGRTITMEDESLDKTKQFPDMREYIRLAQ